MSMFSLVTSSSTTASSRRSSLRKSISSASSISIGSTVITRWIIDTRGLWPGDNIQESAGEYLALVPEAERNAILRKHNIADARTSLASALLKRSYVAKATGIPWADVRFRRRGHAKHGKPCWDPPSYSPGIALSWPQLDFNVAHQAGLATLVGICIKGGVNVSNEGEDQVLVGCDIVHTNERADLAAIGTSDFEDFTAKFRGIFSEDELFDMTYHVPSTSVALLNGEYLSPEALGRLDRTIVCNQDLQIVMPNGRIEHFSSDRIIDAKLRQFYTHFCMKEAYVKLGGEGLLAPWIKDCEFRLVRAPRAGSITRYSTHGAWGGKVTGGRSYVKAATAMFTNTTISQDEQEMEIWLHGEEVHDVITEVQAFEEDFMLSSMIKPSSALGPKAEFPAWEKVDLERDILALAVASAVTAAMVDSFEKGFENLEAAYQKDMHTLCSQEVAMENLISSVSATTVESAYASDMHIPRRERMASIAVAATA